MEGGGEGEGRGRGGEGRGRGGEDDLLVHIKVLLVDRLSPDFNTVYNRVGRGRGRGMEEGGGMGGEDDLLVHIKVLLVDRPNRRSSFALLQTHRFVTVDFNCLETTVNLQTWVVLLDFFGLGANMDSFKEGSASAATDVADDIQAPAAAAPGDNQFLVFLIIIYFYFLIF